MKKKIILATLIITFSFFGADRVSAVTMDYFVTSGTDATATSSEAFTADDLGNLNASDDQYYLTANDWPEGIIEFIEDRYLEFIFEPNISEDAVINNVQIIHEFGRTSALNGRKLEVGDGINFVDYPLLNPPNNSTDVSETIDLSAQIDTPMKVNNLKARFLAFKEVEIASDVKTRHDLVKLVVDYSLLEPPDTTPPIITLLGDETVEIEQDASYTDAGATAVDDIDGDITDQIIVTGLPVDTSVPGPHPITYDVSDSAGNAAIEVTRTVNVNEVIVLPSLPVEPNTPGSHRRSGSTGRVFFLPANPPDPLPDSSSAGEIGGGQVLGEVTFRFNNDLRRGSRSLPDVLELQKRLAEELYYFGPITGYFGPYTALILRDYQQAHGLSVTGTLDKTTRDELNNGKVVANPKVVNQLLGLDNLGRLSI